MKRLRAAAMLSAVLILTGMLLSCQSALDIEVLGYVTPKEVEAPAQSTEAIRSNYSKDEARPIPLQFYYQHSLEDLLSDADAVIIGRVFSSSPQQILSFQAHDAGFEEFFQIEGCVNEVQAMSVLKGQIVPGEAVEVRTSESLLRWMLDASTLESIAYSALDRRSLALDTTYLFFLKQSDDRSLYLANEMQGALEIRDDMVMPMENILETPSPLSALLNDIFTHMLQPQPVRSHNRPFIVEDE